MSEYVDGFGRVISQVQVPGTKTSLPIDPRSELARQIARQAPQDPTGKGAPAPLIPGGSAFPIVQRRSMPKAVPILVGVGALGALLLILRRMRKRR